MKYSDTGESFKAEAMNFCLKKKILFILESQYSLNHSINKMLEKKICYFF